MFKPDILMLHVTAKHVHAEIDATYGSRRMCIELREQSFNIGRYLPWRKAFSSSPNYLERQFVVPTPNTHWVSDMTYISEATGERRFSIIDERYKTGG